MKIKEVIARTGLTDRAIRLYMDNGLINPSCGESHSGRKSIDFSAEDVEQLQRIALLRKAGFSLSDIPLLRQGGEPAKQTVLRLLETTRARAEQDAAVIRRLETLERDEEITVEAVCACLSATTLSEQSIPEEDAHPPLAERVERAVFLVLGGVGMAVSLFLIVPLAVYCGANFIHTRVSTAAVLCIPLLTLLGITVTLLIIYWRSRMLGIPTKRRRITAEVLGVLWGILLIWGLRYSSVLLLVPPVYSKTEDPNDYLVVDRYVREYYKDDVYGLFPLTIPDEMVVGRSVWGNLYTETTRYYYRYSHDVDPEFDIVAEWVLPKDEEYALAKARVLNSPDPVTHQERRGDWQCVYFEDYDPEKMRHDYYVILFAYDDTTHTVRYIMSYCMDAADGAYTPYYFELEWE